MNRPRRGTWQGWKSWTLACGGLSLVVVPVLGGKVVSVLSPRCGELLATNHLPLRRRLPGDRFEDHDASGWDECFPSVLAESITVGSGVVAYPDHGELWTLEWSAEASNDRLDLEAEGLVLPYRIQRSYRIVEEVIRVDVSITNTGTESWPAVFTLHPLCRWAPNLVPSRSGEVPLLPDDGGQTKLWYPVPKGRGTASIDYPDLGSMTLEWDADWVTGLGLWMTNGGYRGDRNLAWEPSSAPFDSAAAARDAGANVWWHPGDQRTFSYGLRWG